MSAQALSFQANGPRPHPLYGVIERQHPSLLQDRVFCGHCRSMHRVDRLECQRSGWAKCHAAVAVEKPTGGA